MTVAKSNTVNKARIARNTLFLYIRMIVVLGVNFYATRLLLKIIGIDDYGIYNIIFGVVTVFTMLNGALSNMVQRFLCYELGRDKERNVRQVFSISLYFFTALAVLIVVASETGGLWFVHHKLNIPAERSSAAQFVYQMSIIAVVFKTLQIPYMSAVISYEKMNFFARISLLEAAVTMGSVALLKCVTWDKLNSYAIFQAAGGGIIWGAYFLFCARNFSMCRKLEKVSRIRVAAMSKFFSWSILGSIANICRNQGLNVVLNLFGGVAMNATWALSQRISGAVGQLVSNFQMAFNPQLLKSYTNTDRREFLQLIYNSSRYSFLLLYLVTYPLFLKTEFFLHLWLAGELPPHLVLFIQLTLGALLVDALNGPLWVAAQADGKIAFYQIFISGVYISSVIASYFLMREGYTVLLVPISVLTGNIVCLGFRMVYLKRFDFSCIEYFLRCLFPVLLVSAFGGGCISCIAG